jgi:hypothetical protein
LKLFINEVPTGVKKMSLTITAGRKDVPNLTSTNIGQSKNPDRNDDSPRASGAWSLFCCQDSELPSAQDENTELLNLRGVHVNYGPPGTDSDSETGDAAQLREISDEGRRIAPFIAMTTAGFLSTVGLVAVGSMGCWFRSDYSRNDSGCNAAMIVWGVFLAASLTACTQGVKGLFATNRPDNSN